MMMLTPRSLSAARVRSSTCATAAIEASASPRKPIVRSAKRSLASEIFDVAWRSKARRASVSLIPLPLSITCTRLFPASSTMTCTCVAPASMEFSTNSLITDEGRCTTSPAAIWLATESGKRCMMSLMEFSYFFFFPSNFCKGGVRRIEGLSSVPAFFGRHS